MIKYLTLFLLLSNSCLAKTHKIRVTKYCPKCKYCGTRGLTYKDKNAFSFGAAINRKYAPKWLLKAKFIRFKKDNKKWSRWYKIDDTGRGPLKNKERSLWVDIRNPYNTHKQNFNFGNSFRIVEVK